MLRPHCGQQHFVALHVLSQGGSPPRAGEGWKPSACGRGEGEITSQSEGHKTPVVLHWMTDPRPLLQPHCLLPCSVDLGQFGSPCWLISSWRGVPGRGNSVPVCGNIQPLFRVKLPKGCSLSCHPLFSRLSHHQQPWCVCKVPQIPQQGWAPSEVGGRAGALLSWRSVTFFSCTRRRSVCALFRCVCMSRVRHYCSSPLCTDWARIRMAQFSPSSMQWHGREGGDVCCTHMGLT